MLKLAIKHYLKSIGDKSFVPNPDYPEFISADCLDVVIKRKPKFFWQRPIYTYDNFSLNDLLDSPIPDDKSQFFKKPEPLTPNYTITDKHSINGKIGAKIASLVSLDLSGGDVISFSIDLEDMMKQSIDYSAVQNMLKTKKVNMKSKYLNRLALDKYNVICLISQYIYVNKATTITVGLDVDVKESGDISKKCCSIDDSGSYHSDNKKVICFDAGTKLAFRFAECLISADGTIELLDRSDPVTNEKMINTGSDKVQPPNYCAHITVDNQNYDIPDCDSSDDLALVFKCLAYLLNEKHTLELKKHLLGLALENKNVLTNLELFLYYCQQDTTDSKCDVESLEIFDREMIENEHLKQIFMCIELPMEASTIYEQAQSLPGDLLGGILCLIQTIHHLETPHLETLQRVLSSHTRSEIEELILFLQTVKFLSFHSTVAYDRLAKDCDVKRLLRTVGVYETESELNEYFEPVLILLYGHV